VLALYGEYDWFEDAAAHALIADIVNRSRPGQGRFAVIPRTDHHFMRFRDQVAAFQEQGGEVNAAAALAEMLAWLRGLPSAAGATE
jgi:hypothetical protein